MVSASGLKRFCRYPVVLDRIPPRTAQERTREANKKASADKGTLGHKLFEEWCLGQVSQTEDAELRGYLDLLASQWRPPPTYEAEIAWGLTPDGNYRDVIEPEPHVYQAVDGAPLLTAGRADGIWVGPDRSLYVIDFKFGKWPVEAAVSNLQVNAAGLALSVKEFAKTYIPGIYYARDGVFDWGAPVELGSPEWKARLAEVQEAASLDEAPHTGPHCEVCWSRSKCPAYGAVKP